MSWKEYQHWNKKSLKPKLGCFSYLGLCNKSLHNTAVGTIAIYYFSHLCGSAGQFLFWFHPSSLIGLHSAGESMGARKLFMTSLTCLALLGRFPCGLSTSRYMVVLVTGAENNLWPYLIYLTSSLVDLGQFTFSLLRSVSYLGNCESNPNCLRFS